MTAEEICANAAIIIMAGSETTATLLSGLVFRLLKDPPILEKLMKEVRSAFQSESEMTFAEEAKLPYLQACIDEGLRIYPPIPSVIPRMTPPGGEVISGFNIPENVCFIILGMLWEVMY
jgi:cytochrome P450